MSHYSETRPRVIRCAKCGASETTTSRSRKYCHACSNMGNSYRGKRHEPD